MKKIMFTGDNLTSDERKAYLEKGYKIDAYDVNLTNEQIINYVNKNQYNGYILGGDEILDEKTITSFDSSMQVISFYGVGYEAYINTLATTKKGIMVTNTPGTNTNAVAEHTIALMLASMRNIVFNNTNVKEGKWEKEKINDLSGLTIGIIGMGAIGSQVAKILCYGFKSNVLYFNRTRKPNIETEIGIKYVSLDELLKKSDIITLHCSQNDETKNIIDKKSISKMKDNVVIINTARASLIEPKALYENLESGKIRTVAFDAFYKEPINLKTDKDFGQFLKFNNKQLIITPHTAYFSNQALKQMKDLAIQNCIDIFEKGKCDYQVNYIK